MALLSGWRVMNMYNYLYHCQYISTPVEIYFFNHHICVQFGFNCLATVNMSEFEHHLRANVKEETNCKALYYTPGNGR